MKQGGSPEFWYVIGTYTFLVSGSKGSHKKQFHIDIQARTLN